MANGDPFLPPPITAWPQYSTRRNDGESEVVAARWRDSQYDWERVYLNGVYGASAAEDNAFVEEARQRLHEEIRLSRDPHEIIMHVERRYETALIGRQRMQRERDYYRGLSLQQAAQLMRLAEREDTPMMAGRIGSFQVASQEQQMASGVDWGRLPEVAMYQQQNERGLLSALRIPSEMLAASKGSKIQIVGEPTKPTVTGRIIDLEG